MLAPYHSPDNSQTNLDSLLNVAVCFWHFSDVVQTSQEATRQHLHRNWLSVWKVEYLFVEGPTLLQFPVNTMLYETNG